MPWETHKTPVTESAILLVSTKECNAHPDNQSRQILCTHSGPILYGVKETAWLQPQVIKQCLFAYKTKSRKNN